MKYPRAHGHNFGLEYRVETALSPKKNKKTKKTKKKHVIKMAATRKQRGRATPKTAVSTNSPLSSSKQEPPQKFVCPICDEFIIDDVSDKSGQDSVYCDGVCLTWLHRRCAGLSKKAFGVIRQSSNPFCCPQCKLENQEQELKSLRDLVTNLSSHLSIVADDLETLKARVGE